jgi:hypothetical protein
MWGFKVRKTPDTALYSIYLSTLWCICIILCNMQTLAVQHMLRKGASYRSHERDLRNVYFGEYFACKCANIEPGKIRQFCWGGGKGETERR